MKTKVYQRKTHSHGEERIGVLEEVRVPGEKLTPESPLIGAMNHEKRTYVSTTSLCYDIKQAIVAAGFSWRPYVLRRYFEICMMNAEYEKLILREWREFWMGHVGNIESEYTVNKGLPKEVAERMRQAYSQAAAKHLETLAQPTISKDEVVNTARDSSSRTLRPKMRPCSSLRPTRRLRTAERRFRLTLLRRSALQSRAREPLGEAS